jgi:methylenetetrahydrofolate reductase (NADPH)
MFRPPQAALPDAPRQALARAVQEAYLEVFPSPGIEQKLEALEAGAWVAITCSPRRGIAATLDLGARLVDRGLRIVPHLAARMVRDRAQLREIMDRLKGLGVESVFVVGGDARQPLGSYTTALQLLQDIAALDHGLRHIGVAAHPEGHPAVDGEVLLQALADKQPLANYLVTQLCFDAAALAAWLGSIRARGISMPAWIGVPGVLDRPALLATSLRIGVGASLRVLRDRGRTVGRLFAPKVYHPDALLCDLAPWLPDAGLGVAGFHLFCFNRVTETEDWRRQFVADCRPDRTGVAS